MRYLFVFLVLFLVGCAGFSEVPPSQVYEIPPGKGLSVQCTYDEGKYISTPVAAITAVIGDDAKGLKFHDQIRPVADTFFQQAQ